MGPLSTPAITTNTCFEVAQQPRGRSLKVSLTTGINKMDHFTAVILFLTWAVVFLALAVLALVALIMCTKPQSCNREIRTDDPEGVSIPPSGEDNAGRASEPRVQTNSHEFHFFDNSGVPITGDRMRELQAEYPRHKGRKYMPAGGVAARKTKTQPPNLDERQENSPLLADDDGDDADDELGDAIPDHRSPRYPAHTLWAPKALSASSTTAQPQSRPADIMTSSRAVAPKQKDTRTFNVNGREMYGKELTKPQRDSSFGAPRQRMLISRGGIASRREVDESDDDCASVDSVGSLVGTFRDKGKKDVQLEKEPNTRRKSDSPVRVKGSGTAPDLRRTQFEQRTVGLQEGA